MPLDIGSESRLWIAMRDPKREGMWIPVTASVKSVGTSTVHFYNHPDVNIEFCYQAKEGAEVRCKTMYYITTGKSE